MSHAHGNDQPVLKITRLIHATRQEVFSAWIDAEQVKQWMCPEGSSVALAELDVRIGGAFRVEMQVSDTSIMHTGVYKEITPPIRLAFTWLSKHTQYRESFVTVEFFDRGESTELVITQSQLPDEEAVQRHTDGWTKLTEHLEVFLQQRYFGRGHE